MTQSLNRLSKEREAEIRRTNEKVPHKYEVELLSEIAALRIEVSERNKSIKGQAYLLNEALKDRDHWKQAFESRTSEHVWRDENAKLRAENARYEDLHAEYICVNAKLRAALESIAARHLDPFCPELFDDYMAIMHEDVRIAREALK